MRLGVRVDNGQIKHSTLGLWFLDMKKSCLFWLSFKNDSRRVETPEEGWYVVDADPLSNTLTLCVPIINQLTGEPIFDRDAYEIAVMREGMPAVTVDMDEIFSITIRKPIYAKKLPEPAEGGIVNTAVGE